MGTNIIYEPDNSSIELSAYEKLRLHNIHRNEAKLQSLGLLRPLPSDRRKGKPNSGGTKKRGSTAQVSVPSVPTRTSGRKRKAVSYYNPDATVADDEEHISRPSDTDDESDYDGNAVAGGDIDDSDDETTGGFNEENNNEDSNGHHSSPSAPSKNKKRRTVKLTTTADSTPQNQLPETDPTDLGGITVENAKSGRATCRLCRVTIPKHAPRVGMQAWIVGRQANTWQCPPCFLSNLTCRYESSGRSRCKITGRSFGKGEMKVGTRSHTATSYFGVDVVGRVIGAVVRGMEGNKKDVLRADGIDGYELLKEEDRVKLRKMINVCTIVEPKLIAEASENVSTDSASDITMSKSLHTKGKIKIEVRSDGAEDRQIPQPELGRKSGAKGKVEWKFGGRLCYGTLLPSKETKTHCYARTHKGNVKTLAKGKSYWSILA